MTIQSVITAAKITPQPGAVWDPDRKGVRFTLYSAHATGVELCLFDEKGQCQTGSVMLQKDADGYWSGFVPGAVPGQAYGYRVDGPFDPANGHRFNKHKLLLDPYAKQVVGRIIHDQALFAYNWGGSPNDPNNINRTDSAPYMAKAVVTDSAAVFDWGGARRPTTPWARSIVYETHVKGFTKLKDDVPAALRGTYAGLGSKASIEHLKKICTAVELMPVHLSVEECALSKRGLGNYWKYNSINFFTPTPDYMAGDDPDEFRKMVRSLNNSGLEVLMDVVYNHTAEGSEYGPTLSFRGIDNATYYALNPEDRSQYINDSGCGNLVNANHPVVTKLIADSLAHFIDAYHISGFRFDLMAGLGRDCNKGFAYNRDAPVYKAIEAVAARRDTPVKISGEPWDCGPGGYQIGNLPSIAYEWSDKFRDGVRDFWLAGTSSTALASGLAGAAETFNNDGKYKAHRLRARVGDSAAALAVRHNSYFWPRANRSVNKLTSHDGFTLRDVFEYNQKNNMANGENNCDGPNERSINCGADGPVQDPVIRQRRLQNIFNMIASVTLAHGPLLIRMGDELLQTQGGNNNAYCQDNPTSWLDWGNLQKDDAKTVLEFWRYMLDIRKSMAVLNRAQFPHGLKKDADGVGDLSWYSSNGQERRPQDWQDPGNLCFGMMLNNKSFPERTSAVLAPVGRNTRLLAVFNAHKDWVDFTLPAVPGGGRWHALVNTTMPRPAAGATGFSNHAQGGGYKIPPNSTVIFAQGPAPRAA